MPYCLGSAANLTHLQIEQTPSHDRHPPADHRSNQRRDGGMQSASPQYNPAEEQRKVGQAVAPSSGISLVLTRNLWSQSTGLVAECYYIYEHGHNRSVGWKDRALRAVEYFNSIQRHAKEKF